MIEEVFGVRMFSCYGHSEKLVLAAECEHSTDCHVWPTYGFFELIDEQGEVITTPCSFPATAHVLAWSGLQVVFADLEPATGNLDPRNKGHILDLLFRSVDAQGATLLAVTHDHELLPRFDRVVNFLDFRSGALA